MSGRASGSRKAHALRKEIGEARGPNGRRLCTWCRKEVPKGRISWCSAACVSAYRIQADPSYFRDQVWKRDKGVCSTCGLDTAALERELEEIRRAENVPDYPGGYAGNACWGIRRLFMALHGWTWDKWKMCLWEADHIVPVVEGGTDSLENARTLCVPCHRRETAALRKRLSLSRTKQPALPMEKP
jgi:Restriction endonuclease